MCSSSTAALRLSPPVGLQSSDALGRLTAIPSLMVIVGRLIFLGRSARWVGDQLATVPDLPWRRTSGMGFLRRIRSRWSDRFADPADRRRHGGPDAIAWAQHQGCRRHRGRGIAGVRAACFFLGQFVSPPIITVVRSIAGDTSGGSPAAGLAGSSARWSQWWLPSAAVGQIGSGMPPGSEVVARDQSPPSLSAGRRNGDDRADLAGARSPPRLTSRLRQPLLTAWISLAGPLTRTASATGIYNGGRSPSTISRSTSWGRAFAVAIVWISGTSPRSVSSAIITSASIRYGPARFAPR